MSKRSLAKSLAAIAALSGGTAIAQQPANPLADAAREANERFRDVATALAEGYAPMPCVSRPAGGAMGVHYVSVAYLEDGAADVAKPEALMYEPQPDGTLELLGVEFITFTGPAVLQGHLLHFVNAPNRYGLDPFFELHVWAWRGNPNGTFADFNPDVSCDAMPLDAG